MLILDPQLELLSFLPRSTPLVEQVVWDSMVSMSSSPIDLPASMSYDWLSVTLGSILEASCLISHIQSSQQYQPASPNPTISCMHLHHQVTSSVV